MLQPLQFLKSITNICRPRFVGSAADLWGFIRGFRNDVVGFNSWIPQPTSGLWFRNSMTNLCWPRFLNSTRMVKFVNSITSLGLRFINSTTNLRAFVREFYNSLGFGLWISQPLSFGRSVLEFHNKSLGRQSSWILRPCSEPRFTWFHNSPQDSPSWIQTLLCIVHESYLNACLSE
jgi:hypothetical protein